MSKICLASDHSTIRSILIVDSQPVLRVGLCALIDAEPGLGICAQADSLHSALSAIESAHPDLVIVGLSLEGRDGLDLLRELKVRCPQVPALVLSMHDEAIYGERCLRAGARGYVVKQAPGATVVEAIRRVLAGETYMSVALEAMLAAKFINGGTLAGGSPLDALTDRELQVFRHIGEGRTTRQTAEALMLSVKTIESHIEHIKHKLMLTSATELAHRAIQWVETDRLS